MDKLRVSIHSQRPPMPSFRPALAIFAISLLASTSAIAKQDVLDKIFVADMFVKTLSNNIHDGTVYTGTTRAELERLTGPARGPKKGDGDPFSTRTYKVGECELEVHFLEEWVGSLRLKLTPQCSFDLNRFVSARTGSFPPANAMTFGDFDKVAKGRGRYYSECLVACGNSKPTAVYQDWSDPIYDEMSDDDSFNQVELPHVRLEVELSDNASVDASRAWIKGMGKDPYDEWVINAMFNCSDEFDAAAHTAFRDIRPTAITVGTYPPDDTDLLKGHCPYVES